MEYLHSIRKQFKEEVIVYFQTHVCIACSQFFNSCTLQNGTAARRKVNS